MLYVILISAMQSVAPVTVHAPPAKSVRPDPNEVICRYEAQSGSLISARACYTRAQLDQRERYIQEGLRLSNRQNTCGDASCRSAGTHLGGH